MQITDAHRSPLRRLVHRVIARSAHTLPDETGANLAEYALIITVVTLVAVPAMKQLGPLVEAFYTVANALFS